MDLYRLQALWKVGRITPDALPPVAADLLSRGLDTPALRELAAAWTSSSDEIRTLADRVFHEAGVPPITDAQARWTAARATAEDMLTGAIDARDGASTLAWLCADLGMPSKLFAFAQLSAEDVLAGEDPYAYESWFNREALAAARTMLALPPDDE